MAWWDFMDDYGSVADQSTGDLYFDDWGGGGSNLDSFDLGSLQDVPIESFDYASYVPADDWGSAANLYSFPSQDLSYGPGVTFGGDAPSQDMNYFTGPLRDQDLSLWDKAKGLAYGAENWTDSHKGLTSLGVGALSFLSSANNAKKQAKYQKDALARAEAERAARNAKTAQQNAAWVPTEFRTRNTSVAGPTVADRYGISGRGSSSNNAPSNYDYFTKNYAQLAKGGLSHVRHPTGGQDDEVPTMLSGGEYVFDADAVSALGDGNNEAGAAKLDKMRANIRTHKRAAPASKIPPKAKTPEAYLKGKK